ncbi:hypothetical protein GCM10007276_17880 [Agaricicola taiwanensis]|uniref:Mechanosensitive ion channel family protein n=1 Tax=Agaricicola taiwanensis TaxID=591372 RepID=A0A8J2VNP3_9RHOB|nr:mechanosensitive ion channel family protein [Agaricicola taiwanensis]GGE40917.1 hypothetical protein GCM10007276_17880 [Agaricicola taiwanensis]
MSASIENLVNLEIYGNSLIVWCLSIFFSIVVYSVAVTARRVARRRFPLHTGGDGLFITQFLGAQARATQQFFLVALALGTLAYLLILPTRIEGILAALVTIAVMVQVGIWATAALALWIARYLARTTDRDPASASAAQIIQFLCQVVIWSALLMLTLSNFGVDITGLIAGLGVGGVAIAFALQSVLRDLFASLAIVLDKPFVIGDFIVFGNHLGTVERVGLKTTRIRSLWGEQISVSNDDLLNTRVQNYKRMRERRISFNVVVPYETSPDNLEAIPGLIRDIIEGTEKTRFDRSHVAAFEEFGARVETIYFVLSPDFNLYMDIQQSINLGIARAFAERGIRFSYPTRRLVSENGEELALLKHLDPVQT